MTRSTFAFVLSLSSLLGFAACNQAQPVSEQSSALGVSVCLSLGTGCCDTDADCKSTGTRTETCNTSTHLCQVQTDTTQCNLLNALVNCDDHDLCTLDTCTSGATCQHTATLLCCLTDANCDDGHSCTVDTCKLGLLGGAGQCQHSAVPDPLCCESNSDCGGAQVTGCGQATCQTTLLAPYKTCLAPPMSGGATCCNTANDCPEQACHKATCSAHACVYSVDLELSTCCGSANDCVTVNACQIGLCTNATCAINVNVGVVIGGKTCCTTASDCGANDSCHTSACVDNQCVSNDICSTADMMPVVEQPADMGSKQVGPWPYYPGEADGGVTPTPTPDMAGPQYALRGGGCNVAGSTPTSAGAAWLLCVGFLFVMRRRRAH